MREYGSSFTLPVLDRLWAMLAAAALGMAVAALERLLGQLAPVSMYLIVAQWSAVLLAGACLLGRRGKTDARPAVAVWPCLLAGVWTVAVMAAFPLLVGTTLELNARVSNVFVLMAARSLLVAVAMGPLGLAWSAIARASSLALQCRPVAPRRESAVLHPTASAARASWRDRLPLRGRVGSRHGVPRLHLVLFVLGLLAARWLEVRGVSVPNLAVGVAWGLMGLAAVAALHRGRRPAARWRIVPAAAAAVLVMAGPWLSGQYDPIRAARLLFSTNVFLARQGGIPPRLLPVLDEARPVAVVEGTQGTYTVWKSRGVQFHVRESGIPQSWISSQPGLCPHYSPEVLPAAMPLTLHEQPYRVLMLGLGSGVPLSTALAFPVQDVLCVEPDAGRLAVLRDHVWPACGHDPLDDERVRFLPLDPVLALACGRERFDVIVSTPDQPSLAEATPYFTREFYRQAARRLSDDGLFCQRFSCLDLGSAPVQVLARTAQSAFADVVLMEAAAGEMLLLATNAPAGVARDGLMDRLQRPHVRQVLARLGWDWSVPLNLPAYDHAALAEIAQSPRLWKRALCALRLSREPRVPVAVNTAGNGGFAFRLPQEVMRWAPKRQQLGELLAQHAGRFAQWGDIDPTDPDLLRRLAEVTGQARLMAGSPDQYWDYRQTLRDQVRSSSRSKIVKVGGQTESRLHPEDQRRMAYFSALSHALRQRPVDPRDIEPVEQFAAPYDPLLSYFLHQEVAELYKKAEPRHVRIELAHRLHALYFAHPADHSVRSVTEALRLIAEHPEALDSAEQRWDHLGALLQILMQRWNLRSSGPAATTAVLLNDIDQSLSALDAAFTQMDRLDRELALEGTHWPARKAYLERTLSRPLRTYRAQLLPHHIKARDKAEDAGTDGSK